MQREDIADAESLDSEYDYEDEYDEDEEEEEEEEDLLFGRIPKIPGLIAIVAVIVVIILLVAAMTMESFGFVGGIESISVNIPGQEGDLLDDTLDVHATTKTPTFGRNANGNGDLKMYYDDAVVYEASIKLNSGRGVKSIPYDEFYVENGEYTAEVTYEGKSDSDTIELRRTAHHMITAQSDWMAADTERVRYKISLFPDEDSTSSYDLLYLPGEGHIQVYYVDNEDDQEDEDEWEPGINITYTTDFRNFEYEFPDKGKENLSSVQGYLIDFNADELVSKQGEGYYTFICYFKNTYVSREGSFTDWIHSMPEENPTNSYRWVKLGDEE